MSEPKLTHEHMAALIKASLTETGTTQAELARRSGMTEKHVSQTLNGHNTRSTAALDYWAFLLGLRFVVTLEPRPTGDPEEDSDR